MRLVVNLVVKTKLGSRRRDSNPRPALYEVGCLPSSVMCVDSLQVPGSVEDSARDATERLSAPRLAVSLAVSPIPGGRV
jgi:hypothetical protein